MAKYSLVECRYRTEVDSVREFIMQCYIQYLHRIQTYLHHVQVATRLNKSADVDYEPLLEGISTIIEEESGTRSAAQRYQDVFWDMLNLKRCNLVRSDSLVDHAAHYSVADQLVAALDCVFYPGVRMSNDKYGITGFVKARVPMREYLFITLQQVADKLDSVNALLQKDDMIRATQG